MSAAPTQEPDPASARAKPILDRLLEIGLDLANDLHAEAKFADPDSLSTADAIPLYDQLSRAIRRNILLAERLQESARRVETNRIAARKRIIREVEDTIDRSARPTDRLVLQAELLERLETLDLDEEIDNRPIPDIIADIRHDLGLSNTDGLRLYRRRTPEDVAALRARAAQSTTAQSKNPLPPAGEGLGEGGAPAATPTRLDARSPAPWRDTG